MINLLPEANKKEIQAGRTNLLLVRYNILMLGVLVFSLIAVGVLYFYLSTTKAAAEQTIGDNRAKVSEYSQIESDAARFRSHLATAKQILDQEIVYTDIILNISKIIPKGIVFDTLALDPKAFGTPTTLTARAKTVDAASELKEAFQNSSIFSDVKFQSLSLSEDDKTGYPYTVSISVTINKGVAK